MGLIERLSSLPDHEVEELSIAFQEARHAYTDDPCPYEPESDLETAWELGRIAYRDDTNPFIR